MSKKNFLNGNNNPKNRNITNITEENGQLFFEIGTEVTNDIAEAVFLLIKNDVKDNSIWDIKLGAQREISPIKTLYWLTGGDLVWGNKKGLLNYWGDCGHVFVDEFGDDIIDIVNNSVKLSDVRDALLLNMSNFKQCNYSLHKYC